MLYKIDVDWDILLKDNQYAGKYALIYTSLVSIILLAPLFFYFIYMKNIHIIQNELFLKEKVFLIIESMEEYNQNEEYFEYPRFKTFKSGLYKKNFQKIFSLIDDDVNYFKEGYHFDDTDAYLIVKLPKDRYFGAKYLVLKNSLSFAVVYERVAIILFSIIILIFILSLFFLNRFARPFQKMNKTLDNFIKDSIHEINTPLSIISVNIDLYNRKNEPNKYMDRMKSATKVLSNIYNDMDYLIKHDRVEYDLQHLDMTKFLNDRVEYFSEIALMKNITIELSVTENIKISINSKQLQRLVDNNISNAIKYSNEESIVKVHFFRQGSFYYLSFIDCGVGIENVDKIFHRYYREDTNTGGFGIGLNIVKSIIEQNSIELEIKSQLHKGSTFSYKFPHDIIKTNTLL